MRKAVVAEINEKCKLVSMPAKAACELCGAPLEDCEYDGDQDGIIVYCNECGHSNMFSDEA